MKNFKWVAPAVILLSVFPISLNFLINIYFDRLDTQLYEEKKARVEARRKAEKMFPEMTEQGILQTPANEASELTDDPSITNPPAQ
ncbi:hypothetical protein [Motilimonas pumila]|uniref:Uncharacterized protein n=1 Tax=Motilimonas pumila TaxID=2303987 RepID=A0A418YHA1_9GAMM|nr:hypothetical protein [Motilimonas pumila]RJG49486.1 hypothetical protein D1Z90_05885 [Motilimonas pumila]